MERCSQVAYRILEAVQDLKLILMAVRELGGELVFTLAAFYGLYQAFVYLARGHRTIRRIWHKG